MLKVALNGGYDDDDQENCAKVRAFVAAFVPRLLSAGHVIYGAARTPFDADVADAVQSFAANTGRDAQELLLSWAAGQSTSHNVGTIRESERPDWDPAASVSGQPESIERCDVAVFVSGFHGVRRAFSWADRLRKPIIPVAYFGGAAREIYDEERRYFSQKYANRMRQEDYEDLVRIFQSHEEQAGTVVRLISDIAHPRKVITAMSYSQLGNSAAPLEIMFQKHQSACATFGYACERIDHTNARQMIMQDVHQSIAGAAFVIVDLTENSSNVMYEAGFARGAGKQTILTARHDTRLPFDVAGDAVMFWHDDQLDDFERRLEDRIAAIAAEQGRRRLN